MPFSAKWETEFSVGNDELDRQHQIILKLCEDLAACVNDMRAVSDGEFHDIINKMSEYTREHFEDEERWLKMVGYQDMETHIEEHNQFNDEISEIALTSTMGYNDRLRLQRFVSKWWVDHILKEDRKYKGLSP